MADFFSELSDKFNKGVSKLSDNSKAIVEKTKLTSSVYAYNNDKKKLISQLGEELYNCYVLGQDIPENLKGLCQEIHEIESHVEQLQKTIQSMSNTTEAAENRGVICSCGYQNKEGAKFCAKCGTPIEEEV